MSTLNRSIAPGLKNVEHITILRPESFLSSGNIPVYGFRQSDFEIFKLELVFPNAGFIYDTKRGIATATNALLLSGTDKKTAYQINEALDFYGSYIQKSCDYYNASVTLYGNKKYFKESLSILLDAIKAVTFDSKELELYKTRKISGIRVNKQKTSFLSSIAFNDHLFGSDHPLGMFADEEHVADITTDDLKAFYAKAYNTLFIIICADIDGNMKDGLEEALSHSGFAPAEDKKQYAEPLYHSKPGYSDFIQKDGSVQASMCMGTLFPSRRHPDYLKLVLLNLVLGGYFGSRLMKNIREEKGLTYGIGSGISAYRNFSVFKIRCDFKNNAVQEVLDETKKEMRLLRENLIPEEELNLAKNYLVGNFQRSFDGVLAQSERFKLLVDLDSSYDYYESYIEEIRRLSASDLNSVANNYLTDNTFIEVVAGSK